MPQFEHNKILPHSSKEVFDLVMNIDQYHEFLPWCSYSKIISSTENESIADMEIKYGWWTQKYRSKIITNIDGSHYTIEVTAIDGPFEHLQNTWSIQQNTQTNTCNVTFFLDFTMRSTLVSTIVENVFSKLSGQLISAFEERANTIYK